MSRVIVLSGGESTEYEVSLASGAEVAESLAARHDVLPVRIDQSGGWHPDDQSDAMSLHDVLDGLHPDDVVFPVLHGGWGEDGGLQSVLEERGIRFVGCGSTACRTGMSKLATARASAQRGVDTIPVRVLHRADFLAGPDLLTAALARAAEWPLIVKPDEGGSSIGVSLVASHAELRRALDAAFQLDATVLLQPLVSGAEVSVGVWTDADGQVQVTGGSLVHLPDEPGTFFTYDHKYSGAGGWLEIPAAFPPDELAALQDAARRVTLAVDAEAVARVDFFLTDQGVVLNEINTMPGLRRHSHFPRLVADTGTDYDDLLDALVGRARGSRAALSRPA